MRDYYEADYDEYYDYGYFDEYEPEECDDYEYEESRFCKRCGYPVRRDEEPVFDDFEENMWADIPGHPNHQVNMDGQIRHKRKKNILKPHVDKDGYYRMSLGSTDNVPVHRVVCRTFYGEPENDKMQVNHIDCNRCNNNVMNLEWVTPSQNIKWGVTRGNVDPYKGLRRAAEINPKPVRIVETGQVFRSVKDCAEYLGVNPNGVSRVLVGSRKGQRLHGYHLEFVREEEM